MAKQCTKCGDNDIVKEIEKILSTYIKEKDNLIQILNQTQEKFGYIPKEAMIKISDFLNIPVAEVYGVITFYSRFTLKPKGKYNISVCLGTACFVKGSEKILDRAKQLLGIEVGQTTKDRKILNYIY